LIGGKQNLLVNHVQLAEAEAFEAQFKLNPSITCCSAEKFRIQLEGTAASRWNKSAAFIFADSLIKAENYEDNWDSRVIIAGMFYTRMRSLIRDYRNMQKSTAVQKELKAKANKYERKWTVRNTLTWCSYPIVLT
jgi:hypothetical protein